MTGVDSAISRFETRLEALLDELNEIEKRIFLVAAKRSFDAIYEQYNADVMAKPIGV